jgi:hypothetical protein
MRGTAPAQIPGAKISVCHGVGGMFAASGTIICRTSRLGGTVRARTPISVKVAAGPREQGIDHCSFVCGR